MRVQVRYRRDGLFVEPVRADLAELAFRYIRHLAEAQFGQDVAMEVVYGGARHPRAEERGRGPSGKGSQPDARG